tara:strand:- start:77810 stop:78388 length:579 start_codon:yes stop_codon:yes gene_type:complete
MNQQAIYRSIWEEGTVETDCEVTPSGEIINIDTVEPQFDAQHLESEEVELKTSGKVFQVSTNEDGDPVIPELYELNRFDPYEESGMSDLDAQFEPKVISLDAFGIEVTLTGDGGGSITSTLKEGHPEYDAVIDGIESMILAHAIAGIDVNSPSYLEGIETAVLGAANNTDDETPDDDLSAKYVQRGGCTCLI